MPLSVRIRVIIDLQAVTAGWQLVFALFGAFCHVFFPPLFLQNGPKDDTICLRKLLFGARFHVFRVLPGSLLAQRAGEFDIFSIFAIIYLTGEPEGSHYLPAPAK